MIKSVAKNTRKASIGDIQATFPNIYGKPVQSMHYTVTITDDVDRPSTYDDVIALLLQADEGDTVDLIINTAGGYLDSYTAIRNALGLTQAEVTGMLLGAAHSAGSAIFLSCHNFLVGEGSAMMIHQPSYGVSGTTRNIQSHTNFATKQNDRWVRSVYQDFLSEAEIESVINGTEIWLDQEEISERLEAREAKKQKDIEAEIAAQTAPPKRSKK